MNVLGRKYAHETACIEPGAEIGEGTQVWHSVHVRAGAQIGRDCSLGKDVYVDAGVTIGDRVRVQNGVSVYAGVELADDVFVGPGVVFTNDRYPRANNSTWEIVPTLVGRGASLGANATIVCGVEIGAWAAVGAGSVVTRDVAPFELVVGNPARHYGWVCKCGHILDRSDTPRPPAKRCTSCGEVVVAIGGQR